MVGVVELTINSEIKSRGIRLLFQGYETGTYCFILLFSIVSIPNLFCAIVRFSEGSGDSSTTYHQTSIFLHERFIFIFFYCLFKIKIKKKTLPLEKLWQDHQGSEERNSKQRKFSQVYIDGPLL